MDGQILPGVPRVDGQHPDIFPGSPQAVIGVFTKCLQVRFSGENARDLPFVWDAEPQQPENNSSSATKPSRLYIASEYTAEPDARDRTPALLVDRGTTQLQKITVGNLAKIHLPSRLETYTAWAFVPIAVLCNASTRGNSANLGDIVFAFFASTNHLIRAAFNIHEISPPTLGETVPYRQNNGKVPVYSTTVTLTTMIQYQWTTLPIAARLQEVAVKMNEELTQTTARRPNP